MSCNIYLLQEVLFTEALKVLVVFQTLDSIMCNLCLDIVTVFYGELCE